MQAYPREINLFFLDNNSRDRITRVADGYELANSRRTFGAEELEELINNQPQVFSPNVILRPLFQQRGTACCSIRWRSRRIILLDAAKTLFGHHGIEMPVLVLKRLCHPWWTIQAVKNCRNWVWNLMLCSVILSNWLKHMCLQQAGEEIDLEIEKKQLEKTYRASLKRQQRLTLPLKKQWRRKRLRP